MSDAAGRDYYTHTSVATLWGPGWKNMARAGTWFSRTGPGQVSLADVFDDSYFPYGCNICKLCPLTNTSLNKCSKCKVMLYCCKEHQKVDWNRTHKEWCQAFCACRGQVPTPTDMDSWRESCEQLAIMMEPHITNKKSTVVRKYSVMQPRCRQCFVAASDGAKLITCNECCGVALCESCYEAGTKNVTAFHASSEHPENECDQHFLNLTCMGMVMDHGAPLIIPSDTDCAAPFYPRDWHEYFERKRADFASGIPTFMLRHAAVVAFLTDGLSTPLTIQHVLHQIHQPVQEKLVVHIVGADVSDVSGVSRYLELIRLNPGLKELIIVLIGPDMENHIGEDTPLEAPTGRPLRPSCKTLALINDDVYHEAALTLERPNVIFCPHPGMHDASYTASWRPSIDYIRQQLPTVPVIVTGYTFNEAVRDTALVEQWGMRIVVPATPNPFRGLRPWPDALREGADFHYTGASYAVVRGA